VVSDDEEDAADGTEAQELKRCGFGDGERGTFLLIDRSRLALDDCRL